MINKCAVMIMALCLLSNAGTMAEFLKDSYQKHQISVLIKYKDIFARMCGELKLDAADSVNRQAIGALLFYHSLFTTYDAVDCARGGVLETVYFWHWIDPNPRHRILHLPDSTPLVRLRPPKGFEKYRSFADVDRLPSLYLADAFSGSPAYYHPDCGPMYTFGWCSEREMAFNAVLKVLGFDCKIKQTGIHVWSEALVDLTLKTGKKRRVLVKLDNTFNTVGWGLLKTPQEKWCSDFGSGAQVGWYNKVAQSEKELKAVRAIIVTDSVFCRIESGIEKWYGK